MEMVNYLHKIIYQDVWIRISYNKLTLYTSTLPYFTNFLPEASTCDVLLCKVLSSDALKSCPCSSIEKKYQDQLKSLQGELDQERGQSSALRNRLDSEKEKIEEEEKSLRLRLMASQKVIYSVWKSIFFNFPVCPVKFMLSRIYSMISGTEYILNLRSWC